MKQKFLLNWAERKPPLYALMNDETPPETYERTAGEALAGGVGHITNHAQQLEGAAK